MKRERIMNIIRYLLHKLADVHIDGASNIPPTGGYLVVTNHTSRLDTPFLMLSTARHDVIGLISTKYQKIPFFQWILDSIQVIWISRDEYDFAAFRLAVNYLKRGWIVGIAPEGTRSKTGNLMVGKPGAALLALKSAVQIIPASVSGSSEMVKRFIRFRKMDVTIRFGKPFSLPDASTGDEKSRLIAGTEEIMCQIAALLPEEKRGVYRNHPRLLNILEQEGRIYS
ncbi:MAG: lysophospholipid acyltransferase family protein [Anaerolineaceae bacterium]